MKKTVQQLIDEYRNRQKNAKYDSIMFEIHPGGRLEGFGNISNVYRDGVKVEELKRNEKYHEYQIDSRVRESTICGTPAYTQRITIYGKVVRIYERIEE